MINKNITFDEITKLKNAYFNAVVEYELIVGYGRADPSRKFWLVNDIRVAEQALEFIGMEPITLAKIERIAKKEAERRRKETLGQFIGNYTNHLKEMQEWSLSKAHPNNK